MNLFILCAGLLFLQDIGKTGFLPIAPKSLLTKPSFINLGLLFDNIS